MIGLDLGADQLVAAAEAFGFRFDVPFELAVTPSLIPASATFDEDLPGIAQSAIGQRDVRATPLQMALVAASVSNGGWMMQPYLIDDVFNSSGVVTARTDPIGWQRSMSPSTADVLADLMESVVTSGSGSRAASPRDTDRRQDRNGGGPRHVTTCVVRWIWARRRRPGRRPHRHRGARRDRRVARRRGERRHGCRPHRARAAVCVLRKLGTPSCRGESGPVPGSFYPGAQEIIPALHR